MRKAFACLLLCIPLRALAQAPPQAQPVAIPAGEAIARAQQASTLTGNGTPFHAILKISPAKDKPSDITGSVEIFWQSANTYRTVVTSPNFSQTRIVHGDAIEERNTGDFYPLWLQNYVTALLNPMHLPNMWVGAATPVRLDDIVPCPIAGFTTCSAGTSCLSHQERPGGITNDLATASLCFQSTEPQIRSASDFTYEMNFSNYQTFGNKTIARTYERTMDWMTPSIGSLTILEPLINPDPSLFAIANPTPPADRIETTAVSTLKEESLVIQTDTSPWPPVRGGKTEGYMIVRAVTDRTGQVRFAHKYNSDNAELEYAGVARAMHYKFKPLLVNGVPQEMVMPLVLHFSSHIDEPWPVITGQDISKVSSGCSTPSLPKGLWPSGNVFHIRYGVDKTGKVTSTSFPEANDSPGVPPQLINTAWHALQSCRFSPYEQNGKPTEYIVLFAFTAP